MYIFSLFSLNIRFNGKHSKDNASNQIIINFFVLNVTQSECVCRSLFVLLHCVYYVFVCKVYVYMCVYCVCVCVYACVGCMGVCVCVSVGVCISV